MWILIVNYAGSFSLISAENIPSLNELDGQQEFLSSLGYDTEHIDWYIFDHKPTFEAFRYDEETDDIYPIWC